MAKGQVVKGTPVNHIGPSTGSIAPGKPARMVGTVHEQFDSGRRGNWP